MKKLLVFAAGMLVCGMSQAAYLYWQVDQTDASGISFESARVIAVSGSTTKTLDFADDYGETKNGYSLVDMGVGAAINLDQLSNYASYSYYVELVNYNTSTKTYDVVGTSKNSPTTYAQLVQSNYVDVGDTLQIPQVQNVWHGGTISVPEPTSALLVMMGVGLLALKRRRV